MDIPLWLDIGNLTLVAIGVMILISTGILSRVFRLNRAFQLSFGVILLGIFVVSNAFATIEEMRIIIATFTLFAVIPLTIIFLLVWTFAKNTTMTRIQLATFTGWVLSMSVTLILRAPLGWGGYESLGTLLAVGVVLSLVIGCIGTLFGHLLLKKAEIIAPSKN